MSAKLWQDLGPRIFILLHARCQVKCHMVSKWPFACHWFYQKSVLISLYLAASYALRSFDQHVVLSRMTLHLIIRIMVWGCYSISMYISIGIHPRQYFLQQYVNQNVDSHILSYLHQLKDLFSRVMSVLMSQECLLPILERPMEIPCHDHPDLPTYDVLNMCGR